VDRGKLKSAPFPVIKANFFDRNAFEPALQSTRADWVINCAALANLEECEKHPGQAKILNTDLPRDLATACARA
jgi:dTDP-4-dehydrorhamnose reductase